MNTTNVFLQKVSSMSGMGQLGQFYKTILGSTALLTAITLSASPAQAQNAFLCDRTFYLSQGTNNDVSLNTINTQTSPFTQAPVGGAGGFDYNALAFNAVTGRFYAVSRNPDLSTPGEANYTIFEISNTGNPDPVNGAIAPIATFNLAAQVDDINAPIRNQAFAGDFDGNGNFFVLTNGGDLIQFSITAPGAVTLVGDTDLSNGAVRPFIPDIAFNPVDGRLYGVDRGITGDTNDLVSFPASVAAPAVQTTTVVGANQLLPVNQQLGPFGAAFFDARGNLYLYENFQGGITNNDGRLLQVTNVASAPAVSPLGDAPPSLQNDGAACPFSPVLEKTVNPPTIEAGSTVTYSYTVVNNTSLAITNATFEDIMSDGRTYVGNLVNPLGGTANAFTGTNTLTITGINIPANTVTTIQVDVLIPATTPASTLLNQAIIRDGVVAGTTTPIESRSDFPDTPGFPDPTPLPVTPAPPEIGVAKQAGIPVEVSPGIFDTEFTVRVENTGGVALNNVNVTESLQAAFLADPPNTPPANSAVLSGGVDVSETGNTAGGTFQGNIPGNVANANFNGGLTDPADNNLLPPGTTLEIGDFIELTFTVTVEPGVTLTYSNTVAATGTPPTGPAVRDDSQDGLDVDPDNDGDPTNNLEPTVISFTADLALLKRITNVTSTGPAPTSFPTDFFDIVEESSASSATALQAIGVTPSGQIAIDPTIGEPTLQSGDIVEYTVYFINQGGGAAVGTELCDQIPNSTTYSPNSTSLALFDSSGGAVATGVNTADAAVFLEPLVPISSNACLPPSNNPNGTVLTSPFTVGSGQGGFFRFSTIVP